MHSEWLSFTCRKCRYDLHGILEQGICPECGAKHPLATSVPILFDIAPEILRRTHTGILLLATIPAMLTLSLVVSITFTVVHQLFGVDVSQVHWLLSYSSTFGQALYILSSTLVYAAFAIAITHVIQLRHELKRGSESIGGQWRDPLAVAAIGMLCMATATFPMIKAAQPLFRDFVIFSFVLACLIIYVSVVQHVLIMQIMQHVNFRTNSARALSIGCRTAGMVCILSSVVTICAGHKMVIHDVVTSRASTFYGGGLAIALLGMSLLYAPLWFCVSAVIKAQIVIAQGDRPAHEAPG